MATDFLEFKISASAILALKNEGVFERDTLSLTINVAFKGVAARA